MEVNNEKPYIHTLFADPLLASVIIGRSGVNRKNIESSLEILTKGTMAIVINRGWDVKQLQYGIDIQTTLNIYANYDR